VIGNGSHVSTPSAMSLFPRPSSYARYHEVTYLRERIIIDTNILIGMRIFITKQIFSDDKCRSFEYIGLNFIVGVPTYRILLCSRKFARSGSMCNLPNKHSNREKFQHLGANFFPVIGRPLLGKQTSILLVSSVWS